MAGEIQLNSTTMATESSGTITLSNVNSATNRTNLGLGSMATQNANAVAITGGTINTVQPATGQSLTIKDEDGNTAITVGTDNTAASYLSLNFGSYHGDSGGAGSGTRTGNTLDDYEEGTWTPTNYTGGAVSGNNYTKIGRLVTVSCYFANVTFSGTTIGGLPFTSLAYGVGSIAYSDSTNVDGITSNGSTINFRQSNSSVTPDGNYMMLSVTYQI